MKTDLRILLFAHPRSGSTSLYKILQLHPSINILEEPFNENFPDWDPQNKNYRELIMGIPSLDLQIVEFFQTHNGIKLLDYQLPDDLGVHILTRSDFKIIFLRRKNLLQTVVSLLISEQTRVWKRWELTKPIEAHYRNLQPLNIKEIQLRIKTLQKHLDYFETVIDKLPPKQFMKFTYEGLFVPSQ
jgi:LPS sulfotransferase NodH